MKFLKKENAVCPIDRGTKCLFFAVCLYVPETPHCTYAFILSTHAFVLAHS